MLPKGLSFHLLSDDGNKTETNSVKLTVWSMSDGKRRYIRWIHPITPKINLRLILKLLRLVLLYIMTDDVTLLIPILPHIWYPMKWVCCKYYSCFIRLQSVLFRRNVRYQSKSGFWKSSIKLYSNNGATLWSFWPSLSE